MVLKIVISELMFHAAKEIGFPPSEGNVEQILNDLEFNYDVPVKDDTPVTRQGMQVVLNAIEQWQAETVNNYPEMCCGKGE